MSVTASAKAPYQMPILGVPQPEALVDLIARFGDDTKTFEKLPATSNIADTGATAGERVVISDSREAMTAEVMSVRQRNVDALNSVDFYKAAIAGCEEILTGLNPEFTEKQAQQAEINNLKDQMSELMRMNKELIAEVKGLRTGSKQKKED